MNGQTSTALDQVAVQLVPNKEPNTVPNGDESNNPSPDNDHIVFVDPTGVRWRFPFEVSRTWDDVKDLIKLVYVDCLLPERYASLLDHAGEDEVCGQSFNIVKLKPERSLVLSQHWEALVSPGWEFRIEFYGRAFEIDAIFIEKAKRKSVNSSAEGSNPSTGSIVYVAKLLLQNHFGEMALEAEEVSRDTPPVAIEGRGVLGPISSVLEEQREFSCNGRDSTRPLRERIDNHGPPVLYILSPILLNALKAVICFQSPPDSFQPRQYNTNLIESRLENRRFVYPFTDLIHHRQRLLEYREEVKDSHDSGYSETCRQHIDILLKYLDDQLSGALKDVPLMLSQTTPEITFSALWTLLKPGSDVYVREDGKLNAYVIESCRNADGFSWSSLDAYATAYCVTVWNLNFDGQYLTRSVKEVTVPVFDGQRAIKSLPVIPIEYQQDESLRKTLIDRGKRFVDMMKEPALREYNGRSKLQGLGDYNRARVVIDHTTEPWTLDSVKERTSEKDIYVPVTTVEDVVLGKYIRMPKCPCQTCHDKETHQQRRVFDDYDNIDLQRTTTLTDHQYMLCASHVYGFVLKDRVWDVLEVDRLEFPRIQANIIDMLVMKPDSNKQMIKAICEIYGGSYRQAFSSDFVQGKGEGQILLLHGPPGTGKTLTAESVAEYTARPLLSITAADLGHEPVTLEKNLLRFFRNAKRWNAIVLLDEADVYLESRSSHDLQRNSIVSIFLRALDYFQGILFLTTNRVGNFDEAFMSRIHVQIGYDPLDEASRQQIWDNHFKKISRNHETHGLEIRVSYDVKEFVRKSQDLKVLKWNGREIRNAFQTALALACFQAKREGNPVPELTDEHLRQVVNMSQNFKNYLRNTRGGTEEDLALAWNVRNDAVRASG